MIKSPTQKGSIYGSHYIDEIGGWHNWIKSTLCHSVKTVSTFLLSRVDKATKDKGNKWLHNWIYVGYFEYICFHKGNRIKEAELKILIWNFSSNAQIYLPMKSFCLSGHSSIMKPCLWNQLIHRSFIFYESEGVILEGNLNLRLEQNAVCCMKITY